MRPVCDICKQPLTRRGWVGPVARFTCSNTSCPDFGKRTYEIHEQAVESSTPAERSSE
jgi:hypothetical protein